MANLSGLGGAQPREIGQPFEVGTVGAADTGGAPAAVEAQDEAAPAAPVRTRQIGGSTGFRTNLLSGSLQGKLEAAGAAADPNVARIQEAMAEAPAEELTAVLAEAARDNPKAYRTALRGQLETVLGDKTRLQRHLALLDENGDGQLEFSESYASLRGLDFSPPKALLVAGAAHLALGLKMNHGRSTTLNLADAAEGQHKQVHTGGMDEDQRLAKKIDEMLTEDLDGDGYINADDIGRLVEKRQEASDAGWITKKLVGAVNKAEFSALFDLTGGQMNRTDLQDFYSGSLFFSLLKPEVLAERLVQLRS